LAIRTVGSTPPYALDRWIRIVLGSQKRQKWSPPGEPLPADVRADYLDSYAGDRFVESARYVRTYPDELPVLAERLGGIKTPVQIVAGRKDPLVPAANAEFLHDRLPHSRLHFLDAGHFAWEEVPDQYGTLVVEWLQDVHRETASVTRAARP
jgi:pimeloyl-ACP methyl ester carboxylesterase